MTHDRALEAAIPHPTLNPDHARYCTGSPRGHYLGVCDDPGCPKHVRTGPA